MQKPVSVLDPTCFKVVPHVGALDTFQLHNDDGSFRADITEAFLDRLIAHMNERERLTGDLAPLVLGHTKRGEPALAGPPLVGFARNWHKGTLGETGRACAFFDAWVMLDCVEQVKKFPRRSCEVHTYLFEVDPISLLGATTPARDLGLMQLSRDGQSVTVESPGEMTMPDDKEKPKADPKEAGAAKGDEGKLDMLIGLVQQLVSAMGGAGAAGPAGPGAPAAPAAGAGGGEPEMTDAEWEKLLGSGEQGGPNRSGEPEPAKNAMGYPGGDNTHVRLSRLEAENATLKLERDKATVRDSLKAIADKKQITVDETLVTDLSALAPDMRARMLTRIESQAPARLDRQSQSLNGAINAAVADTGGAKRMDRESAAKLQRQASDKIALGQKTSFEAEARAAGYTL